PGVFQEAQHLVFVPAHPGGQVPGLPLGDGPAAGVLAGRGHVAGQPGKGLAEDLVVLPKRLGDGLRHRDEGPAAAACSEASLAACRSPFMAQAQGVWEAWAARSASERIKCWLHWAWVAEASSGLS